MIHRSLFVGKSGRVAPGTLAIAVTAAFVAVAGTAHAQDAKPSATPPKAEAKPPAAPPPAAPPKAETKPSAAPAAPAAPTKPDAKPAAAPKAAPSAAEPSAPAPAPAAAPAPEEEPAPTLPPAASPPPSSGASMPLWPEPASDASALQRQGDSHSQPKTMGEVTEKDRVYAEDWWSHARPILELHGYFRVRAQLEHKFALGRIDPRDRAMWPRPLDDTYVDTANLSTKTQTGPTEACTESESGVGSSTNTSTAIYPCHANMQAGANMRFRLTPELHLSDNLRVLSQIDMLDNLVLGSTPSGYSNVPSANGGYAVSPRSGYSPLGFYDESEAPPSAGVNSSNDSIRVKRAWGEYSMPVGEIRFGRMPFHWGLGMMFNAGDGHDDDAQSTVDRIQLITGLKPLDLYVSAAWDFPNEGVTSDSLALPNPEPYDLGQLDDVDQYVFSIVRKKTPQLERQSLTRGELVLNGGLQLIYRHQTLANDRSSTIDDEGNVNDTTGQCVLAGAEAGAAALGCPVAAAYQTGSYVRRGANAWIPDLWLELKYQKFRFAAEVATVQGSIANIAVDNQDELASGEDSYKIQSWGVATELEQQLVEDKLKLGFRFGWSSGDPDVDGLTPAFGGQSQLGDRTFSTFRFHPSYRVDMILGRAILTREQGTYYFRPSADYDFLRDPNGQRVGGGLAAIWTRASEFIQAPGHERDLGIELNGKIYYQSKDGALNDIPGVLGGFYTEIDYGVLFPMAGLGYPEKLAGQIESELGAAAAETRIAQSLRWYLGVLF
jgi:uncharacterized protein (TIGR04551 family)